MGTGNFDNLDFTKLFQKGACPDIKGMKDINYKRISGDWYLHRTDEPSAPEMLPSCHHSIFNVLEDGSFTAQEEVRIAD